MSAGLSDDAIVFGNVNDKESDDQQKQEQKMMNVLFYVIEQMHILPNVNYLARSGTQSEMIESKIKEHAATEGHATEEKKAEAAH